MRSDLLAELIDTMSKAEKRYFKLSTNLQKGNKKYIQLFDQLDKGLAADIAGSKGQLAVLRNYLQQLILRSLRSFHEEASIDILIRNEINELELLALRKQFVLATRVLERAKHKAQLHERYPLLLEVLEWEVRLRGPESGNNEPEIMSRVHEEWEGAIDHYQAVRRLRELYDRSHFFTVQQGLARTPELERTYREFMSDPLLKATPDELTFLGKVLYHIIHSRYSHATGNAEADAHHSKLAFSLFQKHPERVRDAEPYFNRVLFYRMNDAMRENRYDIAYDMAQTLRQNTYAADPSYNRSVATLMEFSMFQGVGLFDEAHRLVPELEHLRDEEMAGRSKFSLAIIDDQIARHYFATQEYKRSITWSDRILGQKGSGALHNLHSTVRILVLMSHFELKNFEYLKYAARAAYQYLYRHKRLFLIEKEFLNFFMAATEKTSTQDFVDLRDRIQAIRQDTFEQRAIDYYDLMRWIEGRIAGKTYAEIVQSDPDNRKWVKHFRKILTKGA